MNSSRRHHSRFLLDALSVLLPDEAEREVLRFCLRAPESSRPVSAAPRSSDEEPRRSLEKLARIAPSLSPLLYARLRRSGAEAPRAVRDRLRAAYFLESQRGQEVRRASRRTLQVLATAEVTPIPLRGVVLAERYYPDPALRHCHDLDLLIDVNEFPIAVAALVRAGFTRSVDPVSSWGADAQFMDRLGFAVTLHRELFQLPHYGISVKALQERATESLFLGVPVRMLPPSDMLIHVCGHASCSPSRPDLRWISDAWYLTQQLTPLDWASFPRWVQEMRLVLPLAVMLRYLRDELAAPIPLAAVEGLESEIGNTRRLDWEAAIVGAQRGLHSGSLQMLRRCSSSRCRLLLLRCAILPSPTCIRWMTGPLPPASLARWAILHIMRRTCLGLRYLRARVRRGLHGAEMRKDS